jgi:hypothetical protein
MRSTVEPDLGTGPVEVTLLLPLHAAIARRSRRERDMMSLEEG